MVVQRLTKDQQWKTVVEALAVACVAVGGSGMSSSKMNIEFAFSAAWREWPWRSEFPSVSERSAYIYISKSERRNGVIGAFDLGRTMEPYLLESYEWWGAEQALEHIGDRDGPSAEAWRWLGDAFVSDMSGRRG
ncbi:hypothetical protein [Agromyces sp. Soil535]|uniref:hypothetical protein n=1 Tax=Agromyces sp. Soil535 TaxID=1736390 RepID=UPI0006FDF5FD|nr:hypothetical protein [Agromyces sp. Soil535]KRE28270.1 hypothetical protein ASG80_21570 [Agromyces sp. Soil535]